MQEVGGSIPPGSTSLRRLRLLRLGKPSRSEGCRGVARRAKTGLGKPYRKGLPHVVTSLAKWGSAMKYVYILESHDSDGIHTRSIQAWLGHAASTMMSAAPGQ